MARGSSRTVIGLDALIDTINQIGGVAQGEVTRSCRAGASVLLRFAKTKAPQKKGYYKKGLSITKEKNRLKAKASYRMRMKAEMTEFLNETHRPIINAGRYGGDPEGKFYYPTSVEYGRKGAGGKKGAKHYFLHWADTKSEEVKQTMLRNLDKAIKRRVK